MEHFYIDEIEAEDETLHLDIRNIENRPSDYQEWNKLARHLIDRGNYFKFLYERSKSEYAKSKLEAIYYQSIIFSDKSIELNPRNIDSWYNKGIALSNLGKFKEALKCYDRVIEIDLNYFSVWNNIGNALNYLGKFHEAIKSYERVLEKDSHNIIASYNKGLALSNLGEYEEAIKCYDRVIEIDPNNIEAFNAKGYALERLDKYEEAIKCYDRVIEKDPKNIDALNAKGYALERLDKYEEAEQYYNRVAEEYSNEIYSMNEKAKAYQNLQKYDEAIICYDKIILIDANNSNAWLNKGLLFYKLNKYKEAIECYDRALGINKYEKEFNENEKLIDYYHKAIEKDPKKIDALNAKGLALEKLGKYEDAIQLFDIVIAKNPQFVIDTIIKKGNILVSIGDYQTAEKSYNDAIKRDPYNSYVFAKLHTLYSNYTFQYDKAISISQLLLKNLSVSQGQNNVQTKQTNLLNEEILDAKFLLSEDYIKNGNYKHGRKIAEETIKEIPNESINRKIIVRFLIIASYLLQGKKDEGILNLDKFLTYYRNLDIDIKIEENQWNFKGLLNAIKTNKDIDHSTKTILRDLIDLLCGFTDSYQILLKTTAETIEQMNKRKFFR